MPAAAYGRPSCFTRLLLDLLGEAQEALDVRVGDPHCWVGLHQQCGGAPLLRPARAALVQRVVEPRRGAVAGVLFDRLELPVSRPEYGSAVERQNRELAGHLQEMGEVFVRLLLPAGGPDEVEAIG